LPRYRLPVFAGIIMKVADKNIGGDLIFNY
jgi:hypothetical protein